MKTSLLAAAALTLCLAAAAAAQSHADGHGHEDAQGHQHEHQHEHGKPSEQAANVNVAPGEVVRRGSAVGDSPAVKFADVLKEPQKFAGKTVVVEGVVERVCQMQGCWMELAPERGARGLRVNMKDHAFFVPFNAAGLRARAEGTLAVKTLSREDADHFEREGAKLKRNDDGTATEVTFVATGVELRK